MRHLTAISSPLIGPPAPHTPSAPYKAGFTFIEVIVSLALLGILAAVFGLGLTAAMESYYFSRTNVLIAQKGQLTMQRLARELTELTAVHQADANTIVYDRIENSPVPVVHNMKIHYDAAQGVIRLFTDNVEGDVLCNEVAGMELTYFSGSTAWAVADGLQRLATIRLSLSLRRPDDAVHPQHFNTLVYPRNTRNVGGAGP